MYIINFTNFQFSHDFVQLILDKLLLAIIIILAWQLQ